MVKHLSERVYEIIFDTKLHHVVFKLTCLVYFFVHHLKQTGFRFTYYHSKGTIPYIGDKLNTGAK